MSQETWVVKNNTKTILRLNENKLTFKPKQEKDLCFHTKKTISELERDEEIKINLSYNNLITIEKYDPKDDEQKKIIEAIRSEFTAMNPLPPPPDATVGNDLKEIKDLLSSISLNKSDINQEELINAIKSALPEQIEIIKKDKNIVSEEENKDDRIREAALMKLISSGKKAETHLNSFGTETKIESESEGNADLLDGIDI